MMLIDGPRQPPASGGRPKKLVIFLHGYGANGEDLIGLAGPWARELPDAQFVSPNAPEPVPGAPGGYQWFPLTRLDPSETERGTKKAAPVLQSFIEGEMKRYGLTPADVALVGFSQGTMMALHVGLRRPKRLAGIVGFSGAIAAPDRLPAEIKSRPPIILIHGAADPVVPVEALADVKNALRDSNVEFSAHVIPGLQHGIDDQGAALAAKFLQENLA